MKTNHQPATALPWHLGVKQAEQIVYDSTGWAVANATVYHGNAERAETVQNARYVAHAANAYPKLVEALRELRASCPAPKGIRQDFSYILRREVADKLLRELGEEV